MAFVGPLVIRAQSGGFAIASVLLALLLLSSLALMSSVAARSQVVSAGVSLRVLRAEAAADGAIEAQIGRTQGMPPGAPGTLHSLLGEGLIGGHPWAVDDYRIDDEFHVLVGSAPIEETRGSARIGRLVWWMDPARRVTGHRAAIESGELFLAAGALASGVDPLGEHDDHASCAHRARLAAAFPSSIADHASLPGPPEWGGGSDPSFPMEVRLGWYSGQALAELADVTVSGPVDLDACATCWMGVVSALGPTSLSGSGAGVLVALGQLTLEAGASWSGLVLVAGSLRLNEGASVTGLVRSQGPVTLADSSRVTASVCAAYSSLNAAQALLRPLRLQGTSRIAPMPAGLD